MFFIKIQKILHLNYSIFIGLTSFANSILQNEHIQNKKEMVENLW